MTFQNLGWRQGLASTLWPGPEPTPLFDPDCHPSLLIVLLHPRLCHPRLQPQVVSGWALLPVCGQTWGTILRSSITSGTLLRPKLPNQGPLESRAYDLLV